MTEISAAGMAEGAPIVADFLSDWTRMKLHELQAAGFAVDGTTNTEHVGRQYFAISLRAIEPRPRRVRIAAGFNCPPANAAGFAVLLGSIVRGHNLTPRLSRQFWNADYNDLLFNDWGIHHLHLGIGPDPKDNRFVRGTRNVVFARITGDAVYILAVMPHGRGAPPPWAKQQLLEILHNNWPESLEEYRLAGVSRLTALTEPEMLTLRRKRANFLASMPDGTVYAPLGGGNMCSGVSPAAVILVDMYMEQLKAAELHICKQGDQLRDHLAARRIYLDPPMRLSLSEDDGAFYAHVDGVPGIRFWVTDKPGGAAPTAPS